MNCCLHFLNTELAGLAAQYQFIKRKTLNKILL